MSALLLGSGGWIPTPERATCSALLREDDRAFVIDAGTRISHLITMPGLLEGVSTIDIVLTHFHLDHVVGLAYLPTLSVSDPPRVHGPGEWLYSTPTAEILVASSHHRCSRSGGDASRVGEIEAGGLALGPFEPDPGPATPHGSHPGLRIGDELTYCTDTAYDEDNAKFAAGSRILAHEAWWTQDAPREEASHSAASASGANRA